MTDVLLELPGAARGKMATKLLEAAAKLDLPVGVIRSQSKGFLVPEEVHRYLFPSEYEDGSDPGDDSQGDYYDRLDFAILREEAKARGLSAGGSAKDISARLRADDADRQAEPALTKTDGDTDPAEDDADDLSDLTDSELEALTEPDEK